MRRADVGTGPYGRGPAWRKIVSWGATTRRALPGAGDHKGRPYDFHEIALASRVLPEAKPLHGADAPPHLRWGPDVELRDAALQAGALLHFLELRVAHRPGVQLRPQTILLCRSPNYITPGRSEFAPGKFSALLRNLRR